MLKKFNNEASARNFAPIMRLPYKGANEHS
jgi:hypothetical protein